MMTRKQAAETALWEAILKAWSEKNISRARELDSCLIGIEGLTDQQFNLWCPAEVILVLT